LKKWRYFYSDPLDQREDDIMDIASKTTIDLENSNRTASLMRKFENENESL